MNKYDVQELHELQLLQTTLLSKETQIKVLT